MSGNTFLVLIIIVWVLVGLYILYSKYMKKDKIRPVEPSEEEIRVFHIFPDYTKNMPYKCKAGEKLHFIARGYTDINQIRGVPINGDKVIWDYTKGNGKFIGKRNIQTGEYTGDSIDYIAPDKENLVFISAHYLNFTDATWIKVIK